MPKIRIGFSTDFNLVNEQVGIGTTNPESRLNVPGQILADNTAGSGGVSTYREYQGFHQTQSNVSHKVTIDATTAGNLNSLSGELRIDGDVTIASDTSVTSGKIDSLTATDKFAVPLGETNNRENTPEAGTTRFNQDFGTLEFFDGVNWKTVNSYARPGGGGRGVIGGGATPADNNKSDRIESIQIQSLGRATDFGNLTQPRRYVTSCSSSIRGIFAGGLYPTNTDIIEYVTIASGGNAIDFGNIVTSDGTTSNVKSAASSCSSSTRGIFAGGYRPASSNGINYIEIATTGNALVFGELIQSGYYGSGCSSSVRGVFQGHTNNNSLTNYEMITIASTGDAIDFGEANFKRTANSMASNSVRGINAGGYNALSPWFSFVVNSIEYITIASNGSAEYFGDLTGIRSNSFNGCSTNTRGVFCGGYTPASLLETCDYVTIMTQGNAEDFGNLSGKRRALGQCSDSHGGLGGF